jgi:hypothetical protein
MLLGAADDGAWVTAGFGLAVGGTAIGRDGAAFCWPAPGTGPGEPSPFGPGLGAVPGVLETAAALVGLGLGTQDVAAGGKEAWAAGAGEVIGAELA